MGWRSDRGDRMGLSGWEGLGMQREVCRMVAAPGEQNAAGVWRAWALTKPVS